MNEPEGKAKLRHLFVAGRMAGGYLLEHCTVHVYYRYPAYTLV